MRPKLIFLPGDASEADRNRRALRRWRDLAARGVNKEPDPIARIEMLHEALRALDGCSFRANLKAAGINRQNERPAAPFGRPRLRRIVGGWQLADELCGNDLASLTVY